MITILLDHNARALLVFQEGRKLFRAVSIGSHGVKVIKFDKSERRFMRDAEFAGKPYPVPRAVRHFKRAGKLFGITKAASKALKSVQLQWGAV